MKPLARLVLGVAVLAGSASFAAFGQSVISAKSGLIHYAEGTVYLGDQLVESKFGSFPDIKENAQFRTEEGRAEVLLTPGVFLRMGESSAIRMITNRLIDTRVEFLSGSILVEANDLLKDNAVTLVYKDYTIQLMKKGLYRFDSEPAALRVYEGSANAELNGVTEEVREGHLLAFDGELKLAKFNKDDTDGLYRWSRRRSEYLAMANVSAAKSLRDSGSYSLTNGGYSPFTNGWYFNPFFNMYTFVPYRGVMYSPFGYAFWSPFSVYNYLDAYAYAPYYARPSRGVGSSATGSTLANSRLSTTVAHATGSARSTGSSSGSFGNSGSGRSSSTSASSTISSGISRGDAGGGGHAGGHGK